jgi:cell division protein FtsW
MASAAAARDGRPAPRGGSFARRQPAKPRARRIAPPLEHRILVTATLCLLAFGAVMVYSASSPSGVIAGSGLGAGEFVRYLIFGGLGLMAMQVMARGGLRLLSPRVVNLMLIASVALLLLVLAPGFGINVNGARRWFAAGPIQFQPSELMKLSLVLYVAHFLAKNPKRVGARGRRARLIPLITPIAVAAGPGCLLIMVEPDMGTTLVIVFTIAALLVAAGVPLRQLALLGAVAAGIVILFVLAQPYQRARLTSFLHPWASKSTAGFQAVQGQIALGSGGLFGVGLGRSVQKVFYLPEAQTDFILAVVGEELGVMGIGLVVVLYGMIGYAGLRAARRAADRYAKLLATGLTSLILCQGILNIFVVLGIAPLTGVPLPFISYAPTNLCVLLSAVGLLLAIARPGARRLQAVEAPPGDAPADRDRRRRDRGARRAGAGRRRRAEG